MKFGVDAPWYDDPVERMAFNLYAMDMERINEAVEEARENGWDTSMDLIVNTDLNEAERRYVLAQLRKDTY